jgi:hypothetical protein
MQRRAAAVYVAFFLVVGAASYSLIVTAEEPTVSFENPEYELSQNDTFSLGEQQYTVSAVSAEMESSGGGHGGGGGEELVRSGEVAWTNQSAQYTATWENNTTVTFEDEQWQLLIPNTSDPSSFTLRESLNRSAILANDTAADNATVTRDGQPYVVVTENNTSRLVPASEYFPEPTQQQISEDRTIPYNGNETRLNVTASAVTLTWNAPRQNTASLSDQENVTLSNQTYLVSFPDNETVVLTQNFESYRAQTEGIDTFHEQKNGLWGVTILSWVSVIFLVGLAFLPSRY